MQGLIDKNRFCSSFSGKEEGQTEKEKQIDQIYFAYGKKLSPIAEVRYKALDIKDESLGALFEKFHSEMHNIDTMILNALKASFEVVLKQYTFIFLYAINVLN